MNQALGRVEGILEHTLFKGEYPRLLNYGIYIVFFTHAKYFIFGIKILLECPFKFFCNLIFEYKWMCLYPHSKETCAYKGRCAYI